MGSTSDLRSDMQNNDSVIICLMDYTNDYLNSPPGSNGTLSSGIAYSEMGGTVNDPYIEYTEDAASGPANLTSYNGIAKASITSINRITMANITTLNGIS
jgi:hypothetical protein